MKENNARIEVDNIVSELEGISFTLSLIGKGIIYGTGDCELTAKGTDELLFTVACHIDRIARDLEAVNLGVRK